MGKRKERSLVELYKHTVKLSKPRITPILEGNCCIQGPVDESDSEIETEKVCNMGHRSLDESLAVETSSCDGILKCDNQVQKCSVEHADGTCDLVSTEKKITGKESPDEHSLRKLASRDLVETEDNSGSAKKRVNGNVRRARGNKARKGDLAATCSDYQPKGEKLKATNMVEDSEKALEGSDASQLNCKGKLVLGVNQAEDNHEKCYPQNLLNVLEARDITQNADLDVQVCLEDNDLKTQAEADRGVLSIKENEDRGVFLNKENNRSDMCSRDSGVFNSDERPVNEHSLDTSPVVFVGVADERNQPEAVSRGSSMCDIFKGSDSNVHMPASEHNVGICANGDPCDVKSTNESPVIDNPGKLEKTEKFTTILTDVLGNSAETNITILEGTSGCPCTIDTKHVTAGGLPCTTHSEKVINGGTGNSVDAIGEVHLASNQSRLLLQDNDTQTRTTASSIVETPDGYSGHYSPKENACPTGVEPMDSSVDSGHLDLSSSGSLQRRESLNRFVTEGNVSQETVRSFPHSATAVHSSVTLHASQPVTTIKEIEALSSCQEEKDVVSSCSTDPMVFSSAKKALVTTGEGDMAFVPVLTADSPPSPVHHRDDCTMSNASYPPSEPSKVLNQGPVEVGPDSQPELGDKPIETVEKEGSFTLDAGTKLEQDLHTDEDNMKVGPSEMPICFEGSLPCQSLIEKSHEPATVEDDVKVCDICGDTGHEEMLAICSMCNDGAEHIYCMQTMLDEVPEGDWLCEGCKVKQNANFKRVETPQSLLIVSRPACLNNRKQGSYGTARSRLSAKLDKRKLGPERKRAMKGIPSSHVSTKRQAEGLEVGPASKKVGVEIDNVQHGSLNGKVSLVRENSCKALDGGKVKSSLPLLSTGNQLSSGLHDSGKSSNSPGPSSPRLHAGLHLSKSRFVSLNGLASDAAAVDGTSKAGSNISSAAFASLTVKAPLSCKSTDSCLSPRLPSRSSHITKLSTCPKATKDSVEGSWQATAGRENTSSSRAIGGIHKANNTYTPLKCKANTDLSTLTEARVSSDIQSLNCLRTKETRTENVRKDGTDVSTSKVMAKSESIARDSVSAGATNQPLFEKQAMEDTFVKLAPHKVPSPTKDSSQSKPISPEENLAVDPALVAQNSNKKEHMATMRSGEELSQSTASPSMLLEGLITNKGQLSASAEAMCNVVAEKSRGQSLLETTPGIKSLPVVNIPSSFAEDGKKGGSLESKSVAEGLHLAEDCSKGSNPKSFSSLKWSSSNHLPAVGSTRCYKCKELGHSAQSCINRTSGEGGSSSLRVSALIASAARSSREMSDTSGGKLSHCEEMPIPGNIKASENDQDSGQIVLLFESDEQERAGLSETNASMQRPGSPEMSYADIKPKPVLLSKEAIDLHGKVDTKNTVSCEFPTPAADLGRGFSTSEQIPTIGLCKPSLLNHSGTTVKLTGDITSQTVFNQRKKSEWIADGQRYPSHRRLVDNEGHRIPPGDSSKIAATTITEHIAQPVEAAARGNTSYGLAVLADGREQSRMDFREAPCQQSTQVETIKVATFPEHNFLWQGGFEVRRKENVNYFDGIQAHASTCASLKDLDAAKKFPSTVKLEEVPRCSSWPVEFQYSRPSDENIALYFFAKDRESYERPYRKLLEHMLKNDFALRGNFEGVELLIFPSNQLPEKSQRWNRLLYLWGVFIRRKLSCDESSAFDAREGVQGHSSKRSLLAASNFSVHDSPQVHPFPSLGEFSMLEEMDIDMGGGREACVSERALKVPERSSSNIFIQSPSISSQGEGPTRDSSDIQNSFFVEDRKVYCSQRTDEKASENLSLVNKHSVRSSFEPSQGSYLRNPYSKRANDPDLPPGYETSSTRKHHNTGEHSICQGKIIPDVGVGKAVELGACGELTSSHISSQTERIKSNHFGHTHSGPSAVCSNSIERKIKSSDSPRIAHLHSHSPGRRADIEKERGRLRDFEYDRGIDRIKDMEFVRLRAKDGDSDREWRPREREREKDKDRAIGNERERERRVLSRRQEEYSSRESKHHRDSRHERSRSRPSHSRSPPRFGGRLHSPSRRMHIHDHQYSQIHSPDSDYVRHLQASPVRQVYGRSHEFILSPKGKSSNDIVTEGKEGQRKLKKSYSEAYGRESWKEQDAGARICTESKISSRSAFQVADLNEVADLDAATEFSGSSVPVHSQPEDSDYHLFFPKDSQVTERLFFPGPEDAMRDYKTTKLSEQWPVSLGSKQKSPEPSSTVQFLSAVEENDQEPPDLNVPNLELALGGKNNSPKPGVLPLFVQLLDKTSTQQPTNPVRSRSMQGEHCSSLSLSLGFPLLQKDQIAKTRKEDHTTQGNCSANTSLCLFGRHVDG